MKRWYGKLAGVMVVCVATALTVGCAGAPHADGKEGKSGQGIAASGSVAAASMEGQAAPDFALVDFAGKKRGLRDFRGKPVLLNFWASWCGPCRMEMPDLARAADKYQGKVEFLGVNLTQRDAPEVAQAFLQENHVHYPNLQDVAGEAADHYRIMVIPTSFLIDKNGKLVARIQGPLREADIDQLLKKVLN
jgi:cytochrome c biogenesis protein CcmG, thiol:disulfide interchange protein DsbE